jgi:urease accessory protein UreF
MSVSVFCLSMLRQVWPDRVLDWLSAMVHDLGSAAFMVDLAFMAHETQYTRLFRS